MQSAAKVMPYIDSNFDRMFISKSDNNNYHMAIVFELKKASAARNQWTPCTWSVWIVMIIWSKFFHLIKTDFNCCKGSQTQVWDYHMSWFRQLVDDFDKNIIENWMRVCSVRKDIMMLFAIICYLRVVLHIDIWNLFAFWCIWAFFHYVSCILYLHMNIWWSHWGSVVQTQLGQLNSIYLFLVS